jgi:Arc/MetJ-type ribon-helix-helix transcriptional regulator
MNDMILPPDLERFAADAVASGRYRDRADLLAASVTLLREAEAARAAFRESVMAAQEESDRIGYVTGDEMLARIDAMLARKPARRS